MTASCRHHTWSELAFRESDGLAVALLWHGTTNRIKVVVADVRADDVFEFHVEGGDALAAFHHPFAYALRAEHAGSRRDLCLAPTPERSTV